ncbi:Aste57867_22782 [Aphanomyces stellatus]|uniref:Aste57867_22782 protein n=1 Tax=Aphanomyces stellatus TaxID=120398 RepID=A0A485LMU2_9STRA|nr:hypothetical protein As57867_022712 [Aphanomyces stellatus]VFT99435.1 Aste57867_22782 [Aphanomyces stellatus]
MPPGAAVADASVAAVHPRRIARSHSVASTLVRSALRRPARAVALIKHSISGAYFAIFCAMYVTSKAQDLRALQVYSPLAATCINCAFALLHFYGLAATCSPRLQFPIAPAWARAFNVSSSTEVATSAQLVFFHFIDISCQSYQAYRMSFYLVGRVSSFGFTALVALNCLVTPWFLLIQHKVARKSLVLLTSSLVGFVVSTLFPVFVFLIPAIRFNFINENLRNSPAFLTEGILASRYAIVSSPIDLVTKSAIQASSFLALRRLVQFVDVLKPRSTMTTAVNHKPSISPAVLSQHIRIGHRNRPLLTYVACNLVWGFVLIVLSGVSNFHRTPCPDTCLLEIAPWFDTSCQCVTFELNCAMRNISGDTIDAYLRPDQLGQWLFYIDVRRCSVPNGISTNTLAAFQHIYGLHIIFSNMTVWPRHELELPQSLTTIQIRYSNLTVIPDVLTSVSSNLVYIRLEGAYIASIPDSIYAAWANVSSIALNYLNLTHVPFVVASHPILAKLELRGNFISNITLKWQNQIHMQQPLVTQIDLTANALRDGPWLLIQTGVLLRLGSNPIASVPPTVTAKTLTSRKVVLDDTPYCTTGPAVGCQPKCARYCDSTMIGNLRCDWVCFTEACQFDGGDCDGFGYLRYP